MRRKIAAQLGLCSVFWTGELHALIFHLGLSPHCKSNSHPYFGHTNPEKDPKALSIRAPCLSLPSFLEGEPTWHWPKQLGVVLECRVDLRVFCPGLNALSTIQGVLIECTTFHCSALRFKAVCFSLTDFGKTSRTKAEGPAFVFVLCQLGELA